MRLVLWDIDGTLVETAGHGRRAFGEAFEALFGRKPVCNVPMPGRTDREIALTLLQRNGVRDGEKHLPRMWEALADALAARERDIRAEGHVKEGAQEALEALGSRDDVIQSLLTGNIEPNAAIKLGAFGLERYLDFGAGAYGSQQGVRGDLVAVACERASAKHSVAISPSNVVLIGDTPLDVEAARRGGARAVGVATGPSGPHELREAGADVVLSDLSDTEAVLLAVGVDGG